MKGYEEALLTTDSDQVRQPGLSPGPSLSTTFSSRSKHCSEHSPRMLFQKPGNKMICRKQSLVGRQTRGNSVVTVNSKSYL